MNNTFYLDQSYVLLHRNWRYARYEIDIIASKDGVLHFIELKSGAPIRLVSRKKV